MKKRRTRTESTQQNRAAVLAAARQQFERLGYHGATVDAIAADAGFSKGVVYSQFGSKDDLILAVLEANAEARRQASARALVHLRGPEDLPRLAELAFRESTSSIAWQAALIEFRVHAWRHPDINRRYVELHQRTVDKVSELIGALFERGGVAPPIPPRQIALGALAGVTGAVTELLVDPTLEFADLIAAAGVLARRVGTPEEAPA